MKIKDAEKMLRKAVVNFKKSGGNLVRGGMCFDDNCACPIECLNPQMAEWDNVCAIGLKYGLTLTQTNFIVKGFDYMGDSAPVLSYNLRWFNLGRRLAKDYL